MIDTIHHRPVGQIGFPIAIRWIVTLGVMLVGGVANAGLSPFNVVVVVNQDDPTSVEIADRYMQLRRIPVGNRILLSGVPKGLKIDQDVFLEKILQPILDQINEAGLAPQTQVIAYSSGFPTAVNIDGDVERAPESAIKKYQRPTASLTGLTYLYQFMLAKDTNYLSFVSNFYVRGEFDRHFVNPFFKPELLKRFAKAEADRKAGKFAEAAAEFRTLFDAHPSVAPLAVLSAECHAEAGDVEGAKKSLQDAIGAGWNSANYLRDSKPLAGLVGEDLLARLNNGLNHVQSPMPFDSRVSYLGNGWPVSSKQGGLRYLMSVMLAVVHPRGSTKEQAIAVLEQAAKSESRPGERSEAEFWFTNTSDVRSKTRMPAVPDALLWINDAGYRTEVPKTAMPRGPGKVMGLMLGSPLMRPDPRKWEFLPGAISENLTSLSADFSRDQQDKITVLLHAGAALSCGPVVEPYTLTTKFPTPVSYGYYASGATAIEAMYMGLGNPYQILVVGDPLCQPMADPPRDRWTSTRDGVTLTFRHQGRDAAAGNGEKIAKVAMIELFLNGRFRGMIRPRAEFKVNVKEDADRVDLVLVGNDEMQSRRVNPAGDASKGASLPDAASDQAD